MKESFINQQDKDMDNFTIFKKKLIIKVNGKKIKCTVKEKYYFQMETPTKEHS